MLAPLARLRRCVGLLIELDDADLVWLGEVLTTFLSSVDFEPAAGLFGKWRILARSEQQAAVLRHLAVSRFPVLSGRPLTAAVGQAGRRYAATGWPRDRTANRRPDGLNGDLFDVLSLGSLPSFETMRKIFSDLSGYSKPLQNTQAHADIPLHENRTKISHRRNAARKAG